MLGTAFLFNAVGIQHSALLQRQMRFTAMAVISLVSLMVGTAVAIGGAAIGYGYWALVASSVITPLVASIGFWLATGWIPGMPRRRAGIRSMMHFGGTLTLNGIVAYIGFNADKVMIGRFLGVDAVGIYGRGFQVISMPTDNLNSAVGEVAFSALSRVQNDPVRLRSYFLKGFSFVLGLTLPITIACALFADDVVLVLLGPKWQASTEIVRLLAPTIVVMAIINPMGWLISSLGLVRRSLKIALVFTPLMILGCVLGVPYGVTGVAFAYSAVMVLWVVPHVAWCVHGTAISLRDVAATVIRPLASGVVAGAVGYAVRLMCGEFLSPLPRLVLESGVLGRDVLCRADLCRRPEGALCRPPAWVEAGEDRFRTTPTPPPWSLLDAGHDGPGRGSCSPICRAIAGDRLPCRVTIAASQKATGGVAVVVGRGPVIATTQSR